MDIIAKELDGRSIGSVVEGAVDIDEGLPETFVLASFGQLQRNDGKSVLLMGENGIAVEVDEDDVLRLRFKSDAVRIERLLRAVEEIAANTAPRSVQMNNGHVLFSD